ncbi:MAG: M1 family metallopeptidase [Actinomycetota bacterium]
MRRVLAIVAVLVFAVSCTSGTVETTDVPVTMSLAPPTTLPFLPGSVGIGDEYYPTLGNGGYDVQRYDLDVIYGTNGDVTIEAVITAVAEMNLSRFNLDFAGWEIDQLEIDGVATDYERGDTELVVDHVRIASGTEFEVGVTYRGVPEPIQSQALPFPLGWFSGPEDEQFVVAQPDGAHAWFPNNDHPLDKATFAFQITVPSGFVAAANGELTDVTENGATTTYSWDMDDPMASYLATVIIGETWAIVDDVASTDTSGIPIRNVLPPDLTEDAHEALAKTGEMMTLLEESFGPYPFDEYGIAVVGGFEHALENQTLSVFGRTMVDRPYFEYVLVHELAHQWFGDSVSVAQWSDIWLNEGFATFAELLWVEHLYGPAAYREEVANRKDAALTGEYGPPGTPSPRDLFNRTVYQRGSFVLVALRNEVGDDAFFEILQAHAARHANGNVTTDEFIALAEEISGRDLASLFDTWLYGEEMPK